MRSSHDILSLDIIFFFLVAVFSIGFVVNLLKKIIEISGGISPEKMTKPRPTSEVPVIEDREKRIQRERDELTYGFPTPPPTRAWVKPQPVTRQYVHGQKKAPAPEVAQTPQTEDTVERLLPETYAAVPTEESPLEEILRDQDPVMQGILMSVIIHPPRSRRNAAIRPL